MRILGRLHSIVVVVGLVAAGCTEAPPPPSAAAPHPSGFAQGIDLARDARDYSQELKGSHLDFVARYYRDPASRWPTLTAAEAKMISATGMRLVTVWEWHSGRPDYFSYASGYADAMATYRQAKGIGQPPGSAIYFAVDFNAFDDNIRGGIDPYFRGVHAGFQAAAGPAPPDYRVGVYGSGAVCDYLKRVRLADYAWLSNATAWAGHDRFTGWDIRQYRSSAGLSFDHDTNEARGEYGGFQVGTEYAAMPAAPVAAAAPATPVAAAPQGVPVVAAAAATPPQTRRAGPDELAWLNSFFAGLQGKTNAAPASSQ